MVTVTVLQGILMMIVLMIKIELEIIHKYTSCNIHTEFETGFVESSPFEILEVLCSTGQRSAAVNYLPI